MKKVVAIFIVLLMTITFIPALASGPFYYNGKLVFQGSENEKIDIEEVNLTITGDKFSTPVNEDGTFSYVSYSYCDTAYITIPNDEYYISSELPIDNNKVFPSITDFDQKEVYITRLKKINGQINNYNNSKAIPNAIVTCYRKDEKTNKWELWIENTVSPSAVTTTDENGKFSFNIIDGEYKLEVKQDGYDPYDSFDYEYNNNGVSTITTSSGGSLNPILHLTESKVMHFVSSTPKNGEVIEPADTIKLEFDKSVLKKSVVDNPSNLRLEPEFGITAIKSEVSVSDKQVLIKPYTKLNEGLNYKLILSKNIQATDGSTLKEDKIIKFSASNEQQNNQPTKNEKDSDEQASDKQSNPEQDNNNLLVDIQDHWAKDYIKLLMNKGIINGNKESDGKLYYFPENEITRQEFAKLIVLANNYELVVPHNSPFADDYIIENWAKPYIATAYENGLIKGADNDGKLYFDPNQPITRAEIMTIIGRLYEVSDKTINFSDWDKVPQWAKPYVAACVEKRLVSGYDEEGKRLLKPLNNITRAEAATIIAKLIDINDLNN